MEEMNRLQLRHQVTVLFFFQSTVKDIHDHNTSIECHMVPTHKCKETE